MRKDLFLTLIFIVLALPCRVHAESYDDGDGSLEHPFEIRTPEQLNAISLNSTDWDKHFIMTADINMSAYTGTQYNIIGNSSTKFTGTFDGAGHVVTNLTYATSFPISNVGLFGYTQNAVIKNIVL